LTNASETLFLFTFIKNNNNNVLMNNKLPPEGRKCNFPSIQWSLRADQGLCRRPREAMSSSNLTAENVKPKCPKLVIVSCKRGKGKQVRNHLLNQIKL